MAALTQIEVMNNALAMLGASLISDPAEDSEGARQLSRIYTATVQSELESNAWYFAKAQASLPLSADVPIYKFGNKYTLPADFIRLIELEDSWVFTDIRPVDTAPVPLYEMQGDAILTNISAPLNITYARDMTTSPDLWSPTFSDVVSASLASQSAMTLTKSGEMVKLASNMYAQAIRRAKHANAIQLPPVQFPDSSWIAVRAL